MVPVVPVGFNCEPILDKNLLQHNLLVGAFVADAARELTLKNHCPAAEETNRTTMKKYTNTSGGFGLFKPMAAARSAPANTITVMKFPLFLLVAINCLGISAPVQADILELKNGTVLSGKYAGGTAGTVRFDAGAGMQVIETSQVIALTFTTPAGTTAPAAPVVAAPATPVAAPAKVILPYGTTLLVRMLDSVSSKNKAGATFATRLEYDLVVNGVKAVPAGTIIYGKVQSSTQARRVLGKSTLDLRLTQMVPNGSPIPIATSGYQQAGEASIKKAAKGAAAGAAIGAIAGDAGKGAAIGATASVLVKGQTITVPPNTLLEFSLTQPVTITTAN